MPSNPITRRGFLGTSLSLSLAGTSGVLLASETTKSAIAYKSRNAQAEEEKIRERPKSREDIRSLWPPNTSVTKPPRPKSTGPPMRTLAWSNVATRMMTSGRSSAATCCEWHAPR